MLNKAFKYIETEQLANSKKFSADENNSGYKLGGKGSTTIGDPDILWENIVFIEDKKIIWTHGTFFNEHELTALTDQEVEALMPVDSEEEEGGGD